MRLEREPVVDSSLVVPVSVVTVPVTSVEAWVKESVALSVPVDISVEVCVEPEELREELDEETVESVGLDFALGLGVLGVVLGATGVSFSTIGAFCFASPERARIHSSRS